MSDSMIEEIGKIKLDLTHYPGEDLYCDGEIEDELLAIARDCAAVEYQKIIEERKSSGRILWSGCRSTVP